MSSGAPAAVLTPVGARRATPTSSSDPAARARVGLAAFGAMSLYGALRWGTLLSPAPAWRLLSMVGLSVGIAGVLPVLAIRARALSVAGAALAALAIFPLAGFPLSWLVHARIAVGAHWIGTGLSTLPRLLVPYQDGDRWTRAVIVLGAGALLLAAALLLALAPRPVTTRRSAAAAVPLLVLAVLPSTLLRPQLPYLHGLILFGLLLALVWGERLSGKDVPLTLALTIAAGAAAMLIAPALDSHRPWLNFQGLAGRLSAVQLDEFDFAQRYGPLHWPRAGREVFDVRALHPDYWKAQDLDQFDGRGFIPGIAPSASLPAPDPAARVRFTQTIEVSVRGMQTPDVIAAGFAGAPQQLRAPAQPSLAPGTWTTVSELIPGDSYHVSTYSPMPGPAELIAAGNTGEEGYQLPALADYRSILLPADSSGDGQTAVVFSPFHGAPTAGMAGSPYARAYALARSLAARATGPYAFVQSVLANLRHGYVYDENPPSARWPLESFLFSTRRGYCQQFSGAMALLLRMGGLPARVAGGFTTGTYDSATHQWIVSDLDAHDWVEVWFPHFGWVRFDPTPASAPARSDTVALSAPHARFGTAARPLLSRHRELPPAARSPGAVARAGGGSSSLAGPLLLAGVLALSAGGLALALALRRPHQPEELLDELERALVRCGRPAIPGLTLAALEERLRSSPQAAAYVRALRLNRFALAPLTPTAAQRRALRAQLGHGLGLSGRARALWALPPRRLR